MTDDLQDGRAALPHMPHIPHIPMDELFAAGFHEAQKQRAETKAERERLLLNCRAVLNTEHGKAFLFNLIDQTGVFTGSFTGNSATFYLEGRRSIGLYLYQLLMDADSHALQKLMDFKRNTLAAKEPALP